MLIKNRVTMWVTMFVLQGLDLLTTSFFEVEHEGNPVMARLWASHGFLSLVGLKLGWTCFMLVSYLLIIRRSKKSELLFAMVMQILIALYSFVVLNNALRLLLIERAG